MARLFEPGSLVAIAFTLAPFLFTGMIAGVASLRRTTVGWCKWLLRLVPVLAPFFIGLLEYRQGIRNHAWTGASLSLEMTICAALPASIVGSLIGLGIGSAISKCQDEPTVVGKVATEDIADESGAAP